LKWYVIWTKSPNPHSPRCRFVILRRMCQLFNCFCLNMQGTKETQFCETKCPYFHSKVVYFGVSCQFASYCTYHVELLETFHCSGCFCFYQPFQPLHECDIIQKINWNKLLFSGKMNFFLLKIRPQGSTRICLLSIFLHKHIFTLHSYSLTCPVPLINSWIFV